MSQHEQRKNEEFRRALRDRWVDAAASDREPLIVDAERLWHKIEAGLGRTEETPETPHPAAVPWLRRWNVAVAAAAVILIASLGGLYVREAKGPIPLAGRGDPGSVALLGEEMQTRSAQHLSASGAEPRQSSLRPEGGRCDETKQSCDPAVTLSSVF